MKEPRVFLFAEVDSRLDLSDAERFGEIVKLYEPSERLPNIFGPEFEEDIYQRLMRFRYDPEVDYFIVVGSLIPLFRVATVLSTFDEVPFKVLLFNAVTQSYTEVEITNECDCGTPQTEN